MIDLNELVIRKALISDIDDIYNLIKKIYDDIENKEWYSYSKNIDRYKNFINDGFSFVVCHNDIIVGFLLTYILRDDKTEFFKIIKDNYNNTQNIIEVVNVGLLKEYRGFGLHSKMLKELNILLKNSNIEYLVCTVHPDNTYSLNNFFANGYNKFLKTSLYGGLERYILIKDIKKRRNHMEYKVLYNYFLFKLGIRKILPKKIISKVKVNDCNEKLVLVPENLFVLDSRMEKPVYLRESVYNKLCLLNDTIKKDGYKIKLFDAYRSYEKQKVEWEKTLEVTKKENPKLSEDEIIRLNTLKIANPTNGVGGHQTGGAIDITLVTSDLKELDMGSEYLEHIKQTNTYSKDLTDIQKKNRNYLLNNMKKLDFVNFPAEWWHYCYGDRMWAAYKGKKECFYGYIEPTLNDYN